MPSCSYTAAAEIRLLIISNNLLNGHIFGFVPERLQTAPFFGMWGKREDSKRREIRPGPGRKSGRTTQISSQPRLCLMFFVGLRPVHTVPRAYMTREYRPLLAYMARHWRSWAASQWAVRLLWQPSDCMAIFVIFCVVLLSENKYDDDDDGAIHNAAC